MKKIHILIEQVIKNTLKGLHDESAVNVGPKWEFNFEGDEAVINDIKANIEAGNDVTFVEIKDGAEITTRFPEHLLNQCTTTTTITDV